MPLVAAGACAAGAALGAVNGALVAYARIPSIVVDAGDDGRAARRTAMGDRGRVDPGSAGRLSMARPDAGGVSVRRAAATALVLTAALRVGPAQSRRRPRDLRDRIEPDAARLAGFDTALVTFARRSRSLGGADGLAALLNSVRFNQIPSNAGLGLEMKVIAAVVVGGVGDHRRRGQRRRNGARRRAARHDRAGAHVPRRERVLGARDPGRRSSSTAVAFDALRARPSRACGGRRRAGASMTRVATRSFPNGEWVLLVGARRRDRSSSRSSRRTSRPSATSSRVTRLSVELGLLAIALTPVIITGGIDLSVGSMMGLAAVVFGAAYRDWGLPIPRGGARQPCSSAARAAR